MLVIILLIIVVFLVDVTVRRSECSLLVLFVDCFEVYFFFLKFGHDPLLQCFFLLQILVYIFFFVLLVFGFEGVSGSNSALFGFSVDGFYFGHGGVVFEVGGVGGEGSGLVGLLVDVVGDLSEHFEG